jgi:hypothetical protein
MLLFNQHQRALKDHKPKSFLNVEDAPVSGKRQSEKIPPKELF